ncbi:flagellar basal body-associated FliL family protein [Pseudodesulfovibrio sp.]|uniref:flagellar basal body-associated FliL family protein n=1 Tax=unclassified Pseudodesulfovibrio TaxID=2661612 RepID=UPI003B00FCC6
MAEEELEQVGKKGGKLKWIIILVVVILLGVGGWFGYKMFLAPKDDATAEQAADAPAEVPADLQQGQMVPLPVFLVNLADPLGRRYLKLGMEVEVRDEKVSGALTTEQPKIKDALLLLLSSKTYDSLSTMADKVQLKQEVVDRLNQILGKGAILRVYITEMVIQ